MSLNRRQVLTMAAGALAADRIIAPTRALAAPREIQAILFDAFALLDPRPILALAEELYPGKGADLSGAWRTRQFEYTWLRTASHRYRNFWDVTDDALVYAARALRLDLTPENRTRLMNAYLGLKAYPDAAPALALLKADGIRLAYLSNFTKAMLDAGIRNSAMDGVFEHVLTTDAVKTHKPDPRAYQMGIDAFGLRREQCLFVAFAGWDAVGAKWFGYPTFWANRIRQPAEELDASPDGTGDGLKELLDFLKSR